MPAANSVPKSSLRAMIYVQNLLGIGHLRRAGAIAKAAAASGLDVAFVSGGMPVPHLDIGGARFIQLPPVRTEDHDFKTLIGDTGSPVDDAWKAARREQLLAIFEAERPNVLMTELFPFGRRQMRFELLPLLERARAADWRPGIVSSMRDILVTKPRLDRNQEIVETVQKFYDRVLVHGDASVIALETTFPLYAEIAQYVKYTGYVVTPDEDSADEDSPGAEQSVGAGEIVVSAGGGAVGRHYISEVFRLRERLPFQDQRWRFLAGHHMPDDVFERLVAGQGERVIVERSRPDLPSLMRRAKLSISQAGYNTVMELIATGVPAVVVPFEGGVETEQRLRADLLAERGRLQVVRETELTVETLGAAMRRAVAADRHVVAGVDLEGAQRTAVILRELASGG